MSTFPFEESFYLCYPIYKRYYILQGTKLETLCIRIASGVVNLIVLYTLNSHESGPYYHGTTQLFLLLIVLTSG